MSGNARFAVALHALTVLGYASQNGMESVSSQRIATSVNTHPVVIRNLLRSLKKAGLIVSKEGKGGGVRLAKAPSKITLQEIHAAVESDGIFAPNDKPSFQPCPVSRNMKRIFAGLSTEVESAVTQALRGKSLQDLIDRI